MANASLYALHHYSEFLLYLASTVRSYFHIIILIVKLSESDKAK